MAVWRADLQLRVPWDDSPLGYYYWTNVYYGSIRDPDDDDNWRFSLQTLAALMHNVAVDQDRIRVTDVATGGLIYNFSASWDHNLVLVNDFPSVEGSVYVSLLAGGRQVGFKRFRSPVQITDYDGDRLTPSALSYYQGVAESWFLYAPARFCTRDGVLIEDVRVNPYISNWQKRHGTKRSRYRRLHA